MIRFKSPNRERQKDKVSLNYVYYFFLFGFINKFSLKRDLGKGGQTAKHGKWVATKIMNIIRTIRVTVSCMMNKVYLRNFPGIKFDYFKHGLFSWLDPLANNFICILVRYCIDFRLIHIHVKYSLLKKISYQIFFFIFKTWIRDFYSSHPLILNVYESFVDLAFYWGNITNHTWNQRPPLQNPLSPHT